MTLGHYGVIQPSLWGWMAINQPKNNKVLQYRVQLSVFCQEKELNAQQQLGCSVSCNGMAEMVLGDLSHMWRS
jgi:hypothetical protein